MRDGRHKEDAQERWLQLVAGQYGLKLIRRRTTCGRRLYCLRALYDASRVLGRIPDGQLELIKASSGWKRVACWLPLKEIERLLTSWRGPMPIGWGSPFPSRGLGAQPARPDLAGAT